MEGLMKWLLIGGVGYAIYYELSKPGGVLAPGPSAGGNISPNGVLTTPTAQTGGVVAAGTATPSNTKASLLALASADPAYKAQNGLLGYDGWNYYLQKVLGKYGPNWEVTQAATQPRSYLWNIDQFMGFMNAGGINGLGRLFESPVISNIRNGGGLGYWERRLG